MADNLPEGGILKKKYRILSVLGRGAFSKVYLARDVTSVGEFCAIKAINTRDISSGSAQTVTAMFQQESRILTSLSHPGLPKVLDTFIVDNCYFLVMEWIAGQTLLEIMHLRDARIPPLEVMTWAVELCHILEYLHGQKPHPIIMGDLKPNNVMRTYDGILKVVDFGVSRYASPSGGGRSHTFITPGFSPPEQYARRSEIDQRSDIYALGATLYYLMTNENLDRFRFQVPPLSTFVSTAPPRLEAILEKCLQQAPTLRYPSMLDLRRDLEAAIQAENSRKDLRQHQARDILSSLYGSKKRRLDL